jgi:drug/metabolite transporter (DMT)-like permease
VELWAILSVAAAFAQNLRSAVQRGLARRSDVWAATLARFLYAVPLALAVLAGLLALGAPLPGVTVAFALWALVGALAQIAATLLLLRLFALRNFATGTTFAKTETVQAALFGLVALGDRVGALGWTAIAVSLAGIALIAGPGGLRGGPFNRAAAIGLAAGAFFALAAVGYRAAALALAGEGGFLVRAAFTLAAVLVAQTLVMGAWMALRRPASLRACLADWRPGVVVGLAGGLASLGWFAALTLQAAALVKAVGQVELVFAWLTARLAFRERPSPSETLGIALVAGGVAILALGS